LNNIITRKGMTNGKKIVIPFEYDDIKPAIVDGEESEEIFITIQNGEIGLSKISPAGIRYEYLDANDFHSISEFKRGIAIISDYDEKIGEKFAIINTDLDILTEFEYDEIQRVIATHFIVKKDGLYGLIDGNGSEIVPCKWNEIKYNENADCYEIK